MAIAKRVQLKKWIRYLLLFSLVFFVFFLVFINRFIEPILRDRLNTFIVQGSDSLYNYKLEKLKANFFGGNVEVENLHIRVDSNQYFKLLRLDALPSLTMQLDLLKGKMKGLGVFTLIFGKKINITEIVSQEADIKLSRHIRKNIDSNSNIMPLWKAIQPKIKSINIDRIRLDGVKLLYKNADTSESIKLQFDRCEGIFQNVRIDSAASVDTSRLAFAKDASMQFYDLKFRTPDSSYKMKAELINYSSVNRTLQIQDFKLQPTLEGDDFFKYASVQKNRFVLIFEKAKFTNLRLDRFIHNNIIDADSVIIEQPELDIANDKTLPPAFKSKIGNYPHEKLLRAESTIMINGIKIINAKICYTERSEKTGRTAKINIDNMNAIFSNVTNNAVLIRSNPKCVATINARILNTSPIQAKMVFYLDSAEGEFDMQGQIGNANAAQLNPISEPLANIQISALKIQSLGFQMHGDDFSSKGNVQMRYNDLAIIFKKTDKETGAIKTKKFLTKIINKFTIYPSNPSQGVERVARDVQYARVSSTSFFGVVWKTIFFGMQNIMFKTGRYQ
jgi:hypothetical protein